MGMSEVHRELFDHSLEEVGYQIMGTNHGLVIYFMHY